MDMENDFLHKINLEALQKDTGLRLEEISALVNLKNPRAIYKWAKSQEEYGTRPSYNALIKLLEAGAAVETLFGVEYKAAIKEVEKPVSEEQVAMLVKKVLSDLGKAK